ncbi:M1 family metallopeptidase [Deinococcus sp. VB142]|uniref:Aminopeptidase N n=1 Tax=Deinococcus sp. VB142 TaxID=3112952 RepID=A0AAU6Q4M3_9DEIO
MNLRAGLVVAWFVVAGAQAAQSVPSVGDSLFPELGQRGLDVQHYDLRLTVPQPGQPQLSAEVTLTLSTREPLRQLALDLLGPRVSAAQWNGQAVAFSQQGAKLLVTPARPLLPGQQARVHLVYAVTGEQGQPSQNYGLPFRPGWQSVPDGNANFSEPDGTRTFLPSNDHPSDPATFRVQVTVPEGYAAAASGLFVQQRAEAGGRQTFVFSQRTPIPTYALALLVGHLERQLAPDVQVAGQTVRRRDVYAAGLPPDQRVPAGETAEMLQVLSDWFGPYPFDLYGVAVLPGLPLALETATLSTLPPGSNRERVRLHELAHQWFGNRVTLGDWADSWLNEGFATYAELLWAEHQQQDTQTLLEDWYTRLTTRSSRPLRATQPEQLFDETAYFRGALALHALRKQVGDDAFRAFLQEYMQTFSNRPATTAALLERVRSRLGQGAEATLRQWVEAAELPPLP